MQLWEKIGEGVAEWRGNNYACDQPVISEILAHQYDESGSLTYLREPQFRSLETYWYLRLKLSTPKFLELYTQLYPKPSEKFTALGVPRTNEVLDFSSADEYLAHVINTELKNTPLAESASLEYASYIMALTMGAGKTVLIGTIIATEFAMSMDTRDDQFMKNALVFAPGTTIIESLKEISDIPYDKVLPPRLYKQFITNLKLIYVQSGEKTIQAQEGSSYNIIVTNTEKIALRRRHIRKGQMKFDYDNLQAQDRLIENLRLQKIASLPSLGIFSDEAHHTYGSNLDRDLKRVRETINHLHAQTNLICVVNTTGTPYSGTHTLKDVVYWYGLDQGIKDNVLKSLNRSIIAYDFSDTPPEEVFAEVMADFFAKYRDTRLATGQQAKIAFYFKSQDHLDESRKQIEKALAAIGESPSLVLMNTQHSSAKEIEEFNRLNAPDATKRIILLVGKGTEGWNCPSLFATALIRELTTSNNFVLQASTRCLRQVDGNTQSATIYIESKNKRILNNELQKTFGTTLHQLNSTEPGVKETNLVFRKTTYPQLEITKVIRRVVRGHSKTIDPVLTKPIVEDFDKISRGIFTPVTERVGVILSNTGEESEVRITSDVIDTFTAAQMIANNYHLPISKVYSQLKELYGDEVPRSHRDLLFAQVEAQTSQYEEVEARVTQALALIKFVDADGSDIFNRNHDGAYYHTIRYSEPRERLLTHASEFEARNHHNLGFHYSPYNFDSEPEQAFMKEMLERLQERAEDVEDIYFTGGISNVAQTDLYFEYKGEDGRYHNYFPDFVVTKKDGSFLIVEVKATNREGDPEVLRKEKAIRRLEALPENNMKYHILYTDTPIATRKVSEVMEKL